MASRFRTELTTIPEVRIQVGRGGLRTTVGWQMAGSPSQSVALRHIGDRRYSGPLPTDPFLIPGTRTNFGTGSVSEMTSPGLSGFKDVLVATQQREREIRTDLAKARWQLRWAHMRRALTWATLVPALISPVRASAGRAVATRRSEIGVLGENLNATKISVDFNMDTEIAAPHQAMQAAFDRLSGVDRTWVVKTQQQIDRVRARSFAGTVVERLPTSLRRSGSPLVETSEPPLAMSVLAGSSTAYFYPGFVLITGVRNTDVAVIDLTEVEITPSQVNFTESEPLPRDAVVVGKTWAKANKNGSRDKRFANNRELPIASYGGLQLFSSGGLNEAYMFSRSEFCLEFAQAVSAVKTVLGPGRLPGLDGRRKAIAGR